MAHHAHHGQQAHHVTPFGIYVKAILALLCLTILTVAVAYVDLGHFNALVAMAIAATKASIVVLFFMGMKFESNLNRAAFLCAFIGLGIFIGAICTDVFARKEAMMFIEKPPAAGSTTTH